MSDQQVESLIKWLDTFELEARHTSIEEISDGAAIAEALAQIAPEWFTAAWRSKIKLSVGNNWRLKISNLKKIIEAVMEYYVECLNQPLSGYAKPDATKIGEQSDRDELRRLLQLVLGCAVNCDRKQRYITLIMSMEESVQRAIMQSIQELEGSMHGPKLSLGASLNLDSCDSAGIAVEGHTDMTQQRLLAELQIAHDLKDQLGQRCHELDLQLSLLQEEKASLLTENKKLQQRLDEFDVNDESVGPSGGSSSHVYATLRKQVEDLKDEIFKIETSRDDYRLKVELMEKEILELQSRHEELQRSADEVNNLKDEIDALRETADKAVKYESTIESYKKKMEDMSDLRRQVKILEEKNMEYVESRIMLEEESKRATLVRNHLEVCKQQLAECHRRLDEQSNKCDKLEFEAKKSEAKISSLQRERDRLAMERDALRETNEELRCTQGRDIEKTAISGGADRGDEANSSGNELVPHEWREKILLLQHEIKMLRLNETGSDDKLPTVQALLEDSEERLNALRGQNRSANQRIIELENKIEEITENRANDETKIDNTAILQQRLTDLQEELKKSNAEREQLVMQIDEREGTLQNQKQKVFTLQENLSRKEIECNALEERYRKYIEKAKSVIRSLDPKQSNSSPSEIAVLRNQIMEKRKIIEDMERSMKEAKLLREMEEKMMTTAFYHLGFTCQREAVDQHLSALSSSQGHSFLARQRQPAARRTVHPSYNLEYVQ